MPTSGEIDLSAMFTPIQVRNIELVNRFVLPAMQRGWNEDGLPGERLARYYQRRVEGGAALVISEACAVDHPSATQSASYARVTPATGESWRRCADGVRSAGGHFFIQLWHEGGVRATEGDGPHATYPTLSPSGFATGSHPNGRAATLDELAEIRDAFIRGAAIAKAAGASGVEVHGAHGFLLDQFLWGETNRREDQYGGAHAAERARFPAEIVAAIRAEVGEEFVISFRHSQWKEGDYTATVVDSPAELKSMIGVMRAAGVDLFHSSARRFWTPEWPGSDLGFAGWTKRVTDATVIAVGSMGLDIPIMENFRGEVAHATGAPAFAELQRRFERGDFDLLSVGRGQIADPDWVNKVRNGDFDAIRVFAREQLKEPEDAYTELQA